jgi:hypothetical protein
MGMMVSATNLILCRLDVRIEIMECLEARALVRDRGIVWLNADARPNRYTQGRDRNDLIDPLTNIKGLVGFGARQAREGEASAVHNKERARPPIKF